MYVTRKKYITAVTKKTWVYPWVRPKIQSGPQPRTCQLQARTNRNPIPNHDNPNPNHTNPNPDPNPNLKLSQPWTGWVLGCRPDF